MLSHIDVLVRAGVDSIKIEGRVKKAFYVATVVNAYRHVLDGENPTRWEAELDTISHRPYSTGFFYGPAQQSTHDDVYIQRYDWVAQGQTSAKTEEGWTVTVTCRNRFYEGDTLEIVSPHAEVKSITVCNLREVFDETEVPSEVANKAMGCYRFESEEEVYPFDILRVRRKDVARKN